MKEHTITYQTNIWEGDWKYILNGTYLKEIISRCNIHFESKQIIVNNVNNRLLVEECLNKKISEGVIDKYYFVEDYIDEVLDFFLLTKESFNGAYYVSSSELVGIYLNKSKYLLYFKGDSHLYKENNRWIEEGIKLLKERKDIFVVNPTWNNDFDQAKRESIEELSEFYLGYGFSDQCFLIRSNDFKGRIYNDNHSTSKIYPRGNPFEAMVNSYMRNNKLKRLTHKYDSYLHENFKSYKIIKNFPLLTKFYMNTRLDKF